MAVTTDGELKDLQTGATVTYPELFGAAITQPDPLAKAKEDGVEGAITDSVTAGTTASTRPPSAISLRSRTSWVAQYAGKMQFAGFAANDRGWRYSSEGAINGITGNVDLNAFSL